MPLHTPTQPEPVVVGERRVIPLVDAAGDVLPPARLFPQVAEDELTALIAEADRSAPMIVQGFAIVGAGRTIVVDTCLGGRKRGKGPFPGFTSRWPATLAAAGIAPETVDTVVNTHLHHDHVGWNTTDDLKPMFPEARYLVGAAEYEHLRSGRIRHAARVADSVLPIEAAGLLDRVRGEHHIDQAVRLTPAPGHTPGHLIVEVVGGGRTVAITGDLLHHPLQLTRPDLSSMLCGSDREAARTRLTTLGDLADRGAVLLASHFSRSGVVCRSDRGFELREG
ncbi:MBL fold metallo-hydrolase [Rhizohabitans arisaemae]|uniref:MBL fold metallo-hydrolase n=1 Tax=Rhizohabitans arisaemae TaxID=2720610 RepID=UPI0024B0FBE1|nr:MBL fold metallo-hydrolase [Rhizohabitans arisaemae]